MLLQSVGAEIVTEIDAGQKEITQHKVGSLAQTLTIAGFQSRVFSFLVKGKPLGSNTQVNSDPMTARFSMDA